MEVLRAEWEAKDISGAVKLGFSFMEIKDKIVGFVSAHPTVMKALILATHSDITFDYIPEGLGFIRTAYLMFKFGRSNEIVFIDQDKTEKLIITLK